MQSHQANPNEPERTAEWKLAYLRKHALLNGAVALLVLGASVPLHVPDFRFLLAAAGGGVFGYLAWSQPRLKQHLPWLVPIVLVPVVFFAVEFSAGVSNSVGVIQLLSAGFACMSACFLLEARR